MTVYNRFDPADNIESIGFRADRVLQSAELNELQSLAAHRLRSISDALFADGDVIRGAGLIVDPSTGDTVCEAGAVYLAGAVRGVPPAELIIPTVGVIAVGIYLSSETLDELDEPSLLNPAVGTRGYREAGATRLRLEPVWGYNGDGQPGDFFPVWEVDNGYVRAKEPPPQLDAMTQALARYDRDSAGGTYIVNGLGITQGENLASGEQVYIVSEGRARVSGYAVEQSASRRLIYPAHPDLRRIDSEPFSSTTADSQRVSLSRPPARSIEQVRITAERTVTLTHGGYTGAADPLPDSGVLNIQRVWQGATDFTAGTDFTLAAGNVDWSLPGAEPAPGSTYQVTYQHIATVTPTDVDERGFTVEGALPGTVVMTTYDQMLPRIDRLCLTPGGEFEWVTGVAADFTPRPPTVPEDRLVLCSIYQSWDAQRRVIPDGLRVVPMSDLADQASRTALIIEDLAELRLAVDAAGRDSGIKKGLFADPMLSDYMRDGGLEQSAAIVGGALTLPISATAHHIGLDITAPVAPAHTAEPVLEQPMRTGTMLVNPYMSFQPIPKAVILKPAVDRWTDVVTTWASPITERLNAPATPAPIIAVGPIPPGAGSGGSGLGGPGFGGVGSIFNQQSLLNSSTTTRVLSETREDIEHLRPIHVQFELQGMGPGEGLESLSFDGIDVTPEPLPGGSLNASAGGVLKGRFTIPQGVPAGTKAVLFVGTGGSRGEQFFHGQGTRVLRTSQRVTTERWGVVSSPPAEPKIVIGPSTDPLAQTFSLPATRQICGVDLWFAAKSTEVLIQIRETSNGLPIAPGSVAPLEVRVPAADIVTNGPTRITWPPVTLQAGREYALLILCDDAVTALDIAELGAWDPHLGRWVTSQPYQIGVLLSSSNASTWTAHQDRDLAFRLLAAQYSESEHVVELGSVELDAATDLMLFGHADQPSANSALTFELDLPGLGLIHLADAQSVRLPAPVSGLATVRARLRGDTRLAAVLSPGVQLIEGKLGTTGTYYSRTLEAGPDSKVKVIFQALVPGGSSVTVELQAEDPESPWQLVPYLSATDPGSGYVEITHQLTGVDADRLRVRLTLNGNSAARPLVRNLRVVVL